MSARGCGRSAVRREARKVHDPDVHAALQIADRREGRARAGRGRSPRHGEVRLTPLIDTYLEKREALLRYFTARLGSAVAAEDLVQDIYLKLAGLELDAPVQNNAAFLYRLGSNLMLDRLRQRRRAAARDGDWRQINASFSEGEEISDERAADDALAARQRLVLMLAAVEELPEQNRKAFRLHKLEGLSQAETAEALGVSRSSVEKYISAALKHLTARLGG